MFSHRKLARSANFPRLCHPGRMTHRDLYIAAYDVADDRRLRLALDLAKEYATGGQKSVYEVYLTPAEKGDLLANMLTVLDEAQDRFVLLRLDPRAKVYTLGKAVKPKDPAYFYVG